MNARRDPLTTGWNRRQFLRVGGFTVATGALVAACGQSDSGTGIPRVGTVPTTTASPKLTAPVTDVTLLRTATSLEYNAIFVYEALATLGALTGDNAAIAEQVLADHTAHAAATGELTTSLGGEAFTCANPRLQTVYIEPALRLIFGSEVATSELGIPAPDGGVVVEPSTTQDDDVLVFLNALESLAAATYQSVVSALNDKALRAEAITIGAQEAQHAALFGSIINPSQLINVDGVALPAAEAPTTTVAEATGLPTTVAESDTTEAPVAAPTPQYAVPSTFGLLSPIQIQLGAPNESGIRTTVSLETPSLNSLAYEFMTCEA